MYEDLIYRCSISDVRLQYSMFDVPARSLPPNHIATFVPSSFFLFKPLSVLAVRCLLLSDSCYHSHFYSYCALASAPILSQSIFNADSWSASVYIFLFLLRFHLRTPIAFPIDCDSCHMVLWLLMVIGSI